jgi:hypothetical protein
MVKPVTAEELGIYHRELGIYHREHAESLVFTGTTEVGCIASN